jgi:hypothetical protein
VSDMESRLSIRTKGVVYSLRRFERAQFVCHQLG